MPDEATPFKAALDALAAEDAKLKVRLAEIAFEVRTLIRGRELTLAECAEPGKEPAEFDNSRQLSDRRQRDNVIDAILGLDGLVQWCSEAFILQALPELKERSIISALRRLVGSDRLQCHGTRGSWRYRLPPAALQQVAADPGPRQAPLEKPPEVSGSYSSGDPGSINEEGEQDRQTLVRVYSFIQGCGDMGAGESQLNRVGAD